MSADIIFEFLAALRSQGLEPVGDIIADGELHRCRWVGDNNGKNGSYVLHLDGHPAGFAQCWKRNIKFNWCANGAGPDPAFLEKLYAKIETDRLQRKQEERERHERAAQQAQAYLLECQDAEPGHEYLVRKQIGPHGLKVSADGWLVMPLCDTKGEIWSLQLIAPDGTKRFLKSGRKHGLFHPLGEPGDQIVIAEGFATAASIREATGLPVVIAFDSGNLLPVAKAIKGRHPSAHIAIAADDDHATDGNPGLTKAHEAADLIGATVVVPVFEAERGGDFNDMAVLRGHEPVAEIIRAAFFEPAPDPSSEAAVLELAAMSPVEYDRVRKERAKQLGVRIGSLDRAVEKARKKILRAEDDREGKGQPLKIEDPQPWPDLVDGAELVGDIVAAIRRYVILPERAALAAALWAIHAHTMEFATVAPRLLITAPTRECGKTVLLEVSRLVPRPLLASNISPAGIFRTAEVVRPTLMIDEADTFLKENDGLRGIINSGHTRASAFVIRVVEIDGELEPRKFSTWCAMAICGIGSMPGTITSRAITAKMERKLPDERVARLTGRTGRDLDVLCSKIARWVADSREKLESADPVIPARLGNRAADNWLELLAIADLAGDQWPLKAREAALAGVVEEGGDIAIQLLADIRTIFIDSGADKLSSAAIAQRLAEMEGQPWAEFGRNRKPITQNSMARLLKTYKVAPGNIKVGDQVPKGYKRKAFEEAWKRYLPQEGDFDPLYRHRPANPPASEDSAPLPDASDVADGSPPKAKESAAGSDVADKNPPAGERERFVI